MESNEDLNQSCHDKISKLIGKGNKIINEAAENKVGTHYMIMVILEFFLKIICCFN